MNAIRRIPFARIQDEIRAMEAWEATLAMRSKSRKIGKQLRLKWALLRSQCFKKIAEARALAFNQNR